ncbi:hypothetical protein HZS_792 [Henneguya salminicola]|nr:hypothetical protein HZS_792 [Henneguya salminicola]
MRNFSIVEIRLCDCRIARDWQLAHHYYLQNGEVDDITGCLDKDEEERGKCIYYHLSRCYSYSYIVGYKRMMKEAPNDIFLLKIVENMVKDCRDCVGDTPYYRVHLISESFRIA